MYKVKKEHVGKVQVDVDNRTIVLDENTPQDDLEILAADVNAGVFIEKIKAASVASVALNEAKI